MRLSSKATLFYKVILPVIWPLLFAAGAVFAATTHKAPIPTSVWIICPCGFIAGTISAWFVSFPLKHVTLEDSNLRIRDLKLETVVPVSEIASVEGRALQRTESITIIFKNPTIFGPKIKFMPTYRFVHLDDHPTLRLLRGFIR